MSVGKKIWRGRKNRIRTEEEEDDEKEERLYLCLGYVEMAMTWLKGTIHNMFDTIIPMLRHWAKAN